VIPLVRDAFRWIFRCTFPEEMDMNRLETIPSGSERDLPPISVGLSASELIGTVTRQVAVAQAAGNARKALQVALQHLEQRSLIDDEERRSLTRMCDIAMIPSTAEKRTSPAADRLRRLHDDMVLKASAPTAVAIAGAILQHATANEAQGSAQRLGQNPAAGFIGAVLIGGIIGGLAGGPGGALIGVVGGAVGALTDCSGSD
jgi:hypothetical protein